MKTKDAVSTVLAGGKLTKYRMSQDLGCAPVLIDYWLLKTKMGPAYRKLFNKLYGVEIDDSSMEAPANNK